MTKNDKRAGDSVEEAPLQRLRVQTLCICGITVDGTEDEDPAIHFDGEGIDDAVLEALDGADYGCFDGDNGEDEATVEAKRTNLKKA